jgi:hypothetical protein
MLSTFRKFLKQWDGEAQLGANFGLGTVERDTFTGHIKVTHNHKFPQSDHALRNILEYNVWYGRTDDVLSDNRMDGTWTTEFDLSKRFLTYNAFRAGYDEIRKIDLQYEIGPWMGYKWVVRTNFVFKNELGANYQEQYLADGSNITRYSFRLAEDFWWQVTPRLKWDEKLEFFPKVEDFADYRIRFETRLSYLLRENLTLTLNLIDVYDTAVAPDVSKNDLQIRSMLGVKF